MAKKETMAAAVYELVMADHIRDVKAPDSLVGLELIEPISYFMTSGDAVVKAEYLVKTLVQQAKDIKKQYGKKHQKFQSALAGQISDARKLLNILKKVRGEAVFLELEWLDHRLICLPKNPRAKDVEE